MYQDDFFAAFIPLWIGCFVLAILLIVAQWKIYQKAGQPGWACIIPIYSFWVLLKIVGKPGWWLIMMFIPLVNVIFAIWAVNMLSKSFGKDEGFTVGLLLLGFVFYPILGFGNARYLGPYGDPAAFRAAQNPDFDFDKTSPRP
ncbi:MAG TPA: DUF5684 domain-containing protein [Puia sp.]|nr:DUF5684 domain-containing protein [Puia sp.]